MPHRVFIVWILVKIKKLLSAKYKIFIKIVINTKFQVNKFILA